MTRRLLSILFLAGASMNAQDAPPAPTIEAITESFTDGKPLPALEASQRIVTQFAMPKGKDTLVYRRVSAPSMTPSVAGKSVVSTPAPALLPSAEALEQEEARLSRLTYLNPSVVVYPQGVTELKWSDDAGAYKRVFAHASLEFLPLSLSLDLSDWTYGYSFFHWGNGHFGDDITLSQLPADLRDGVVKALSLPNGYYAQVTAENGQFSAMTGREAEAMDALLTYYALNQDELARQHAEAVVQAELWAEAKQLYDAKPKTYEIRVWKNQPKQ